MKILLMAFAFAASAATAVATTVAEPPVDAPACKPLRAELAKAKGAKLPLSLAGYIGKELKDFPCADAGKMGSDQTHEVVHYEFGRRTAVFLVKRVADAQKQLIMDVILLPAFAKGEVYIGPMFCTHKVLKAWALGVGRVAKNSSTYRMASTWVVDRELDKILPVATGTVKCEFDEGVGP